MSEQIVMPKLGLTMKEGTVAKWFKSEGEWINKDEPLVEIMTDKITNQVEAPVSGYLKKIYVQENQKAPVSDVIGIIAETEEELNQPEPDSGAGDSAAAGAAQSSGTKAESGQDAGGAAAASSGPPSGTSDSSGVKGKGGKVKASPMAKRLARERGIDIENVTPTGSGGRITKEDVLNYSEQAAKQPTEAEATAEAELQEGTPSAGVQAQAQAQAQGSSDATTSGTSQEIELTGVRKIISDRMAQSWQRSPHVTITMETDMTKADQFRKQLKSERGIKVSFNDLVIKAAASALNRHPQVNSSLEGDLLKVYDQIKMGVAVAVPDGLLVPVMDNPDTKGLETINKEVKELAEGARNNTLSPDKLSGSTFTITNLGMYDVEIFTPIINPPESAILGVGKIKKQPVVVEESELNGDSYKDEAEEQEYIDIRPMMWLSLSFDHRVVDGAKGAEFLQTVKQFLEDPVTILL